MIILALQSALGITEIALLRGNEILAERAWEAQRDELVKILPMMEELLAGVGAPSGVSPDSCLGLKSGASDGDGGNSPFGRVGSSPFGRVGRILVVNGPGGFSSTRIGVTLANSLGYALKAEIFAMTMHQYETLAGASFGEKVRTFFEQNPEKVEQVLPLYNSAVKITASKKPKFT